MAERPEDLNLPIAVINRLVKESLPDGVNVSKEARTAISKAASVFVLYATSCANNFALKAKRKTLTGQDVLSAMVDMDFEKFVEPLEESLEIYRKGQKGKKDALEQRKKDREAELAANNKDDVDEDDNDEEDDDDEGEDEELGGELKVENHGDDEDDEDPSSNEGNEEEDEEQQEEEEEEAEEMEDDG